MTTVRIKKIELEKLAQHRPVGYLADVLATIEHETETHVAISAERYRQLSEKYSPLVGTELKKLISWFPIPGKHGCPKCRALEARLNCWGADKCEIKIEFILKKLRIAAKRRRVPFSQSLAETLVKRAIRNARKKHP